jgi:hypothetical protein
MKIPESVDGVRIVRSKPGLDVDEETIEGTPRCVNSQVEFYFRHQLQTK